MKMNKKSRFRKKGKRKRTITPNVYKQGYSNRKGDTKFVYLVKIENGKTISLTEEEYRNYKARIMMLKKQEVEHNEKKNLVKHR